MTPGCGGIKTVDALLSSRVLQLKTSDKEDAVPIEEQISKWLHGDGTCPLPFSLDLSPNGDGRDYEVRIKKDSVSPEVTLVDMGYGLSQFLPVLVLCYYAPEGSTLILEQPGIHLHPKVQSQLADLLIEVVTERNLQILVESHSEHLLNRLQRRIAEEKMAVDKTALYFCRNNSGVSACERLEVDEFGNITNWPENFFGNEMGDLPGNGSGANGTSKADGGVMDAVIVDTNVIAIANRKGEHASQDCVECCERRLHQILSHREKVVVDDGWQIFGEYKRYVNLGTRKWIGEIFVKTLLQNLKNPAICEMVHIHAVGGKRHGFRRVSHRRGVEAHSIRTTRKFIAVACAYRQISGQAATILLAIDRGWLNFIDALAAHGVAIDFLCEADIQRHRRED